MAAAIWYLENDDNDVFLLRRAIQRIGYTDSMVHFYRFSELKARLQSGADIPSLFLFDLKLDGESGLDALAWVKSQPRFSKIPAFLFSSGTIPEEILASQELDAGAYIFKPPDFDALKEVAAFLAESAGIPKAEAGQKDGSKTPGSLQSLTA